MKDNSADAAAFSLTTINEALPEAISQTGVSLAPGALFLKLFIPPVFDGAYLSFNPVGEVVGVVDGLGTELLESAHGLAVEGLLRDGTGKLDAERIDLVSRFLDLDLLKAVDIGQDESDKAYWIRPDDASNTAHTGPGADFFIRSFYGYFGAVFHDGSVLIDSHGDFLDAVARYFPHEPGKDCLDAGCGSGHYTAALARLGHRVYGCDISTTRLNATQAKSATPGEIIAVETDISDIPIPDGSVDFAMSIFVLEHVADPFAVTEELVRILRPGGTLLLAVPSFNIRDTLAAWMFNEPPSLNFEHLRSYGLIPGTHPWCANTLDTLDHLRSQNIEILQIEGASIEDGLWEPWLSQFQSISAQLGDSFATTWPWNCFGRQTLIYGRKKEDIDV